MDGKPVDLATINSLHSSPRLPVLPGAGSWAPDAGSYHRLPWSSKQIAEKNGAPAEEAPAEEAAPTPAAEEAAPTPAAE